MSNKQNIEFILQEFREWERLWNAYDNLNYWKDSKAKKPIDAQTFTKELSKHYKVKIKKIK